ncbi:MAG TPA: phage terminase small subunit P27 family [Candidatus Limnocylindrales bacterium]|nr:phage terminase small subunit P27 family [Candidatus Limnocylindrales bacterium]
MGRRGPTPTPTRVKRQRGETRPSRLNRHEPIPPADLPKMPADMDPDAKVVWRRVVRDMRHTGVIRAADADVLRCYCEAVSRYAQAVKLYAGSGPILRDRGHLVKSPLHQLVRDNADLIQRLARELGLSPSARAGLRIEPERAFDSLTAEIGLPPRLRVVGDAG